VPPCVVCTFWIAAVSAFCVDARVGAPGEGYFLWSMTVWLGADLGTQADVLAGHPYSWVCNRSTAETVVGVDSFAPTLLGSGKLFHCFPWRLAAHSVFHLPRALFLSKGTFPAHNLCEWSWPCLGSTLHYSLGLTRQGVKPALRTASPQTNQRGGVA
jgi:hypothetical protein